MRLTKSFQLALNILLHSKLRSWLTIIGIVIGIAAVVSIVSISEGAKQQLEERLQGLGADTLTISSGFSRARGSFGDFRGPDDDRETSSSKSKNLTNKDVLVLRSLDNVKYAIGEVSSRGDLTFSSKTSTLSMKGVDISYWKDVTSEEIDQGRFLTKGDTFSVVLGGNIVSNTFPDGIPLNSKVVIEGKSFKVVGITKSGSTVYMPENIARTVFDDIGENEFDSIYVKIEDVTKSDEIVSLIEKRLMFSRGILFEKDKDFSVSNPAEMQATMEETMNTMSLFLGAIAAISLLVGAIGIANTMFTSVLEKTKEIGIMKAIGAKNKDILIIFMINSGLIGFVGGLGGVVLGVFGSGFISYLGGSTTSSGGPGGGFTRMFSSTAVTPQLLIFALLFSVIIGIIAGIIPAYRASRLKPVDALRYE
jgi:putative ABC transport system permease protein